MKEKKRDQGDHRFTGPKRDWEANGTTVSLCSTGGTCGEKVQFCFRLLYFTFLNQMY